MYDRVCPRSSRPGTFYGNPTIYERVVRNLPKFPPILSAINTPWSYIAMFFIPILETLTPNKFTVKDPSVLLKTKQRKIVRYMWPVLMLSY